MVQLPFLSVECKIGPIFVIPAQAGIQFHNAEAARKA
jgi:hypothetical protein